MITRLRGRERFRELHLEGTRVRTRTFWCTMLLDPTQQDTAVGYAIGRAVGSAVVRNLLRRRLRVLFAQRADRLPPGAMLVGVNRSVAAQVGAWSFAQLETEVDELCRRLSTAAVAS